MSTKVMYKSAGFVAFAVVSVAGLSQSADAATIARESFVINATNGYSTGSNLGVGTQPVGSPADSSGFSGSWQGSTGAIVPTSSGLSINQLDNESGGSINVNVGYNAGPGSRQSDRAIATYTPSSTYWFGAGFSAGTVLASGQQATVGFTNFGNSNGTTVPTSAQKGIEFGLGDGNLVATYTDTTNTRTSSNIATGQAANTTYYIVARLEYATLANGSPDTAVSNKQDRLSFWVNPVAFNNVAALGTATLTVQTNALSDALVATDISYLDLFEKYTNIGGTSVFRVPVQVDEPRFGTTLGDVVAVPEPASLAALGLVGIGLLRRRRAD